MAKLEFIPAPVAEVGLIGYGETLFRQAVIPLRPGMHAEQFKIVNVENNEELASVGS